MEKNNIKIGQHLLKPSPGAKHKSKRVGCGDGSGHGTYSGRGCKGQKSRAGGGVRLGFEGGQLPIIKRLPRKRGFFNSARIQYSLVNTGKLNMFTANTEVTPQMLCDARLVKSGEIDRPLVVKAAKFSSTAKAKIEAAGGRAEGI
jgi:large subunit ribosomal protein L15